MIKYELRENTREVKYKERFEIAPGCTANQDDCESKLIKSFDSKEAALKELEQYESNIYKFDTATGPKYEVTEYFVEEVECNEDGEWIAGGDIWGFSKMEIEVVEKPSYNTIAAFDNFEDAEKTMNDCEEECYLSF